MSVSLQNVVKQFGELEVIHDVSLEIEEGEFIVFVGPSGCGKSTLLRMIAGLEEVTDGEICIKDRDVTDTDPSERGIAMVFQTYALYPHMTVADNLSFGLKMTRQPSTDIDKRVAEASEILKIDHLLHRRPKQLSGGQRQRVAIGRAIVRKPDVFLFDEPLSNLDAELRVSMRVEIARLHKQLDNTMIYVTHDQTEAMTLADRIVILRDGNIEQIGTPRDVYENPANIFVAGFIGSPRINLIKAKWKGAGNVEVAGTAWKTCLEASSLRPEEEIHIGIRPEHAVVADDGLAAEVEFIEYLGGTGYLYCRLPDGQAFVAEARDGSRFRTGDVIHLKTGADETLYFDDQGQRIVTKRQRSDTPLC